MNENSQTETVEKRIEAIFALDLDPIKFKLMDKKEGHGWNRAQADQYELEYKRFLALMVKYPDELITPSAMVDKFWHGHILDTMKYAEDCQNIFGYFLHHFPYFGLRDEADAANLARSAESTKHLYEKEFGGTWTRDASYCQRVDASYCQRADASYCQRVDASYCQRADASYCQRADASYCQRADEQFTKSAQQTTNMNTVLGKGRPKLEPVLTT